MPYNVIILTSTVIALGFGSIFNLLIRRFVLLEEVPKGKLGVLVERLRELVEGGRGKLRGLLKKMKGEEKNVVANGREKKDGENGISIEDVAGKGN